MPSVAPPGLSLYFVKRTQGSRPGLLSNVPAGLPAWGSSAGILGRHGAWCHGQAQRNHASRSPDHMLVPWSSAARPCFSIAQPHARAYGLGMAPFRPRGCPRPFRRTAWGTNTRVRQRRRRLETCVSNPSPSPRFAKGWGTRPAGALALLCHTAPGPCPGLLSNVPAGRLASARLRPKGCRPSHNWPATPPGRTGRHRSLRPHRRAGRRRPLSRPSRPTRRTAAA